MSSISSFFSSFFPTVHNDSEENPEDKKEEEAAPAEEAQTEAAEEEPAEEEEEEPEDEHPKIREDCQNSAKCAQLTKHFEHCQEKVQSGEGFKGEDCVEELMMHCADECAAPKVFAKLR